MKCFIVCYDCKNGFEYLMDEEICKGCGNKIVDPGIKLLVFTLNYCGIKTERSCEGHNGFGYYNHHDFPWLTIADEKDLKKLDLLIDAYNRTYPPIIGFSRWMTGFNIQGRIYWLFPKEKHRRKEDLQKESRFLAKFIMMNFAKIQENTEMVAGSR